MTELIIIQSVLHDKNVGEIPMGLPKQGQKILVGIEKSAIFDHYLAIFQKQYEIGTWLL